MNLKIENIGKMQYADINLNGITIIAGDNNTGKSTVGKVLFSVFNSCYNIEQYIESQKLSRLNRDIEKIIHSHYQIDIDMDDEDFDEFIYKNRLRSRATLNKLLNNNDKQILRIHDYLTEILPEHIMSKLDSTERVCEEIVSIIDTLNNIPSKNFRISRVSNFFNDVFGNQVVNTSNSKGLITASIAGGSFGAEFNKEECIDLMLDFNFNNSATFINNPEALNDREYGFRSRGIINEDLCRKLNKTTRSDSFDVDSTIATDKLYKVYEILNKAVRGKFLKTNTRNESFLFDGMSEPIKINNLSTGVKSFLIIKKLCENSVLVDKDVLILDEPEIHLHPEWQLLYAEALVMLQREFNLTVLITSHSPTFVRAIECYCDVYDRMDILDVYKTKAIDEFNYTLENISYSEYGVSELYEDFSTPFEKLEEIIENKYGSGEESE